MLIQIAGEKLCTLFMSIRGSGYCRAQNGNTAGDTDRLGEAIIELPNTQKTSASLPMTECSLPVNSWLGGTADKQRWQYPRRRRPRNQRVPATRQFAPQTFRSLWGGFILPRSTTNP
jgi:hypothetical protein